MEFDPYHKWLGIPAAEQPPNHYRLLAIALFENDQDVIETAADQRMALLRTFQGGPHSALSQKLLNEVSAARLCLLTPYEKQAYDTALRGRPAGVALQRRMIPHALPVEMALSPPMEPSAIEMETRPLFVADREPPRSTARRRGKSVGRAGAAWLLLAAVAIPAFGFVAYVVSTKPEATPERAETGPLEKSRHVYNAPEPEPGHAPAPAGGEEAASSEPTQSHLSGVDAKAARHPADASCFNGRFYKVFPDKLTWDEARTQCNQMGGRLVVIKSQAENSFVTQLASEAKVDGVWLGATDRAKEGQWEWGDGASVQYNCWDTGQPNNMRRVEHYAVLLVRKAGKWWDYPNDPTEHLDITGPAKPGFICEWQSTESAGAQPDDNTEGVEILDADRRAAEYVLSVGGHVAINGQLDGQGKWRSDVKERITAASELPREAFHLTGVGLKGNRRVTETGLTAFRGTKHLVALNLAGCSGISEASFANFQGNFERDRKLALLVLSETAVGDAGLSCLHECSELRRLDVTRTKVTAEGVKSLRRALPQCKITWDGGEVTLIEPDVAAAPSQTRPTDGFLPLFNGKDLTGWKPHSSQPGKWRVENGVLIGDGPGASYLYSERGDYKDFHLRAEVCINNGGNAGIYARSGFRPAEGSKWPGGYEAQICGGDGKTGSICKGLERVCPAASSPAKLNESFTLELFAIDNHVIVKINGQRTAIYTDNDRSFPEGHIALQHDPQTTVEFRKIEIREHSRADKGKFPLGRFVRIELPRTGTLSLAEVEVYSGGRNIARTGKASQKNTSWGGHASRGIDGNMSGIYTDGGQTCTEENTPEPWWELDLGGMHPIESIVVYNRTEGTLNKRLDGFTLRILDAARQVVAERTGIPAPEVSARYEL
ncbi:MAG TPA: family 16 glycoside hydrolase, partial [Pirellulales bacterium]|nr:family 16 glycoside hydrolase [Pirellulales bacterium]